MSIVIAIFDPIAESLFYADRKMVRHFPDGRIHSEDEIKKNYWITDDIACGFTGMASWCIALAGELLKISGQMPSEMIAFIKTYPYEGYDVGSTFILIGKYDDMRPFIFTYKTSGEWMFEQDRALDAIATSPIELAKRCTDFLCDDFDVHEDINMACINTIKYAASQSPETISESYDIIRLSF